jgi:hypothetical protein
MSTSLIKCLPVPMVLMLAAPCAAQDAATDRFAISLGAFITERDTVTRVDSTTGNLGTVIQFEDDLGLPSSQTVFRLDGHYRFSERHRLDFSVFDLSRHATQTLDQSVQFGDENFSVASSMNTDFDLSIYKLGYTYSFLRSDKGFLGGDIGLHVADVGLTLRTLTNDPLETNSVTAPLPVIGLHGEYYLSDRWTLSGDFEWFAIEIGDVKGHLHDLFIGVDYRILDNLAVGLAYNDVSSRIEYSHDAHHSILDWRYDGILLYFKMAFGSVAGPGSDSEN